MGLLSLNPGNGFGGGTHRLGDRVADLRVADVLDPGEHESDLADTQLVDGRRLRREHADLLDLVLLSLRHQPDLHPRPEHAVDHAREDDHAAIRVVPRIEDECFQRRVRLASRRRQALDDGLEDLVDAGPFFRTREDRACGVETDDVLDLPLGLVRLRTRQIDLVDDRNDLEVVLDGKVRVGQRLRLHALRRVDEQQRPFTRGQRPRDLVGKIHVARRIDQVQHVLLAVVGRIRQADRVRLDGDATLALEVHAVEHLRLHLARLERASHLEKTVSQRRLAVVDVRDDGEVPDVPWIHVRGSC